MTTSLHTWLSQQEPAKVEVAIAKFQADHGVIAESARDYCGGDDRFGLWLMLASNKCARLIGLTIFDIEDWNWRDAYDAGSSPSQALRDCLEDSDHAELLFGGE